VTVVRHLLVFALTGLLCLSADASLYVNTSGGRSADVTVAVGGTATVTLINSSKTSNYTPYYEPGSSEFYSLSPTSPKISKKSSTTLTITGVKPTTEPQTLTMWKDAKKSDTSIAINITVTGGAPLFSVTPYVQHPATNAMTVLFFTTTDCAATARCWPAEATDSVVTQELSATCAVASDLVSTGDSSDKPVWGTQYKHRVRFEGLRTGTKYRYEVELEGGVGYTNSFRTAPGRDTPVRFVAYSDSETTPKDAPDTGGWDVLVNGTNEKKTYPVARSVGFAANIRHMQAWNPDLIVIAGDLVARGGVQMFWDEFWRHNAGANAKGFNDPAGSTPILATLGNHDLYDNKNQDAYNYSLVEKGERALKHYLSYFEYNPNGVDYANAAADERDTRDKSQLFHREDYGPVTLIFLDTTNGNDSDKTKDTNTGLTRNGSSGSRGPDFNPGTLQYQWLERNLADAQAKSRFIFVINHHCPYSVGKHNFANGVNNGDETETHSAQPVRILTPLLHKYGVTAWLCGHDEIQEHSQHVGEATLAGGTTRRHVLNVYDLGSAGDGLKGKQKIDNEFEVFRAYKDAPDGVHYGHLQVEVKPNAKGVWQCTMTPMYSYVTDASGESELRAYKDRIVINEDGSIAYEQRKGVTLVEGDGSVVVDDNGAVTVSEDVRQIEGAGLTAGNVKIVYSDEKSGESYDITGAFTRSETVRTAGTGVVIRLNPEGSVPLGEGEEISVKPTLTKVGDAVEPLVVGETASVGVKTIPGLTYRLKRNESVADVSKGEVITTEKARGTQTRLTDPMNGGKPDRAFYAVEVTE